MPNEDLTDEISALNSIYTPETIVPCSTAATAPKTYTLSLPTKTQQTLTLSFSETYPSDPPTIHGTSNIPGAAGFARDILGQVFRPGEVCLYDFVEGLVEVLQTQEEPEQIKKEQAEEEEEGVDEKGGRELKKDQWIIAPPLTEKKSVFIARVIPVSSPDQVRTYLGRLLADKKIAKATHNISGLSTLRPPPPSPIARDSCNCTDEHSVPYPGPSQKRDLSRQRR